MRKLILLASLALIALITTGCHHGHSSFSYGYSEGGHCEPHYVERHHGHGYRSHGGHGYRGGHCD